MDLHEGNARESDVCEWVQANEGALIVGVDMQSINRLGRRGLLTVRRVPGCRPRYRRSELEAFAARHTSPALASAG